MWRVALRSAAQLQRFRSITESSCPAMTPPLSGYPGIADVGISRYSLGVNRQMFPGYGGRASHTPVKATSSGLFRRHHSIPDEAIFPTARKPPERYEVYYWPQ